MVICIKISVLKILRILLRQEVIFASSAPGFVRADSEGSSRVVQIESPKFAESRESGFDRQMFSDVEAVVDKLDDDQALLTKEELIALQV